jgi:hypothetical protein
MANPFEKRATEYLWDDPAFLSVVTPEPLITFFKKPAAEDRLLDRLVMIIGTPGSGKTTMARLFQYSTIRLLMRNESIEAYKPLLAALRDCGAVNEAGPAIVGARLPMESEYREFWEFPYPDDLKLGLMTALIQARAVLAWFQNLEAAGLDLDSIRIVPRSNAGAALSSIGGSSARQVVDRASEIELAVYQVSAALVPPNVDAIPSVASTAYRPFDVIDSIEITGDDETIRLRPLVILDDAHTLKKEQFELLRRWLARRELKVGRWIITRYDALTPRQVLLQPGLDGEREITYIKMQGESGRSSERLAFRKMAKDMSRRYLKRMDTFSRRGLDDLGSMLLTGAEPMASSKMVRLTARVNAGQKSAGVTQSRREGLTQLIDSYSDNGANLEPEVRLESLAILMARYKIRTRSSERRLSLFDEDGIAQIDPEPSKAISMKSGIADGARVHLMHDFDRAYYYSLDNLCDASSENAEQFLLLASVLVGQLETKLIRGKDVHLSSSEQDKLLRDRATEIIRTWDFPHAGDVRRLAEGMAKACVERSLEPNASLDGGASAIGILQSDYERIPIEFPRLAEVMQFAIAYNAINLVQDYKTKNQVWCLLELGGVLRLKHGLTLSRGGFLERSPEHLEAIFEMAS